MLTAAFERALLPVGTGPRFVDDIDFVSVPGRGLHLVAVTFREERNIHYFSDGTRRAGLKIVL
jgi:hypothetical protein